MTGVAKSFCCTTTSGWFSWVDRPLPSTVVRCWAGTSHHCNHSPRPAILHCMFNAVQTLHPLSTGQDVLFHYCVIRHTNIAISFPFPFSLGRLFAHVPQLPATQPPRRPARTTSSSNTSPRTDLTDHEEEWLRRSLCLAKPLYVFGITVVTADFGHILSRLLQVWLWRTSNTSLSIW